MDINPLIPQHPSPQKRAVVENYKLTGKCTQFSEASPSMFLNQISDIMLIAEVVILLDMLSMAGRFPTQPLKRPFFFSTPYSPFSSYSTFSEDMILPRFTLILTPFLQIKVLS